MIITLADIKKIMNNYYIVFRISRVIFIIIIFKLFGFNIAFIFSFYYFGQYVTGSVLSPKFLLPAKAIKKLEIL